MFGTFFEQSIFVYVITAIGICGIITRLVMNGFLKGLVRDTDKMETTDKKFLSEIRKRYEELAYLEADIRDTKAFVEKYIYKLKIGKIQASTLDGFYRSMMILSGLTGIAGAWWQMGSGASFFESGRMLVLGITVCGLLQIVSNIFNCEQKKRILTAELEAYLNNSLANKMRRSHEKQENAGVRQAAAGVLEPTVIDIDETLNSNTKASNKEASRKKTAKQGKRRKGDSETAAAFAYEKSADVHEREVSQEQIDACDALFDNLLKGISTT